MKLYKWMIKQLLNSVLAKYRDLSVARRSIICLCLRHRQIIDLLATDKSRYFAQTRPIIAILMHWLIITQMSNESQSRSFWRNNIFIFGKLSFRQTVRSAKCPFGKTPVWQNERRQNLRTVASLPTKACEYVLAVGSKPIERASA
jgi:hypothetical protein